MTPEADRRQYDVIVGAGPSGIACAGHAQRAGLRVVVLERGRLTERTCRATTSSVRPVAQRAPAIGSVSPADQRTPAGRQG
ncbi:MAG: FAD-dependent oxidoreductase, partial [Chloroflexota bacterium]